MNWLLEKRAEPNYYYTKESAKVSDMLMARAEMV